MNQNLIEEYQNVFQTNSVPRQFFAPGRINLIGEHIDYNGGHVFPAPISFGTYVVAEKRSDQKLRFFSMNFPETGIIECDLTNLNFNEEHHWANYPKGMIQYIIKSGHELNQGMNILYYGDIPNGAGLSSSASIEIVTGVLLEGLYDLEINPIEMIQLGQKVENDYIGVQTGIMDQFVIRMGKKNHAILLNCETLEYHYALLDLNDYNIIIINTNKRRDLSISNYNERRSQCEQALSDLQTELSIENLCQLTPDQFETYKHLIKDATNQKRAKHAVYENARTLEALKKLQKADLEGLGKLINLSHTSLQDDYEVTGLELDTIVSAAQSKEGVLGARMIGAGFGGCAIAIVKKDRIEAFKRNVNEIYYKTIGYDATFYTASIGEGAREITRECSK
ncbi:galactokinase [Paucisalibacillus globulus]|uniref:galactokinase n=1 Tax=Paucisalibacillus globulus TaxID=351095 RepID=UPI00040C4C94|nr:galactokinase [Paucisalibacillus globulus]